MNENIDLTKILKDCPNGWMLYSPIFGEVYFCQIYDNREYEISVSVIDKNGSYKEEYFSKEGYFLLGFDAKCLLFPSEELLDWSKFTAPWYKKDNLVNPKFKVGDRIRHKETNKDDVYEIRKVYDDSYGIAGFTWMINMKYQDQYELVPNKFDPKTLNAFDRVLVRDEKYVAWRCGFFSHKSCDNTSFPYLTVGQSYRYCIPYNDETKHLVGTTDEAPKYYRYWED